MAVCVFRQNQKRFLKTPSFVEAPCLQNPSVRLFADCSNPISLDEPDTVLGSLQESKRANTRVLLLLAPPHAGLQAGRGQDGGSSPRSVFV